MCCRYPVFIGINVNVNVNVNVRSELELKLKLKGMLLYKHIVKYLDILMIFLMFSKAHLFKEQHLSITDLYAPDCCLPRSRAAELAAKVTSAQDVLPTSGLLATATEMPNIDRILAVNITV